MASLWHYLFLMIFSKSTPYLPGTAASCLGNIKVKKWTSTNRVNPRILSFSFYPWSLSSFLHRARQTPCLASKSKNKKQKHSEQRTLSCVFPSFLSLALIFISASSARRDNSRHTHIQCQNSPKNMITKKSKKRAHHWSILDSYLYFFMERQARQVSKYPYLGKQKKNKKKTENKNSEKRACYRIFPIFFASLALIFIFPYRALGEMILEIPISSPKNITKKGQTTVKLQKKKKVSCLRTLLLQISPFPAFPANIYRSLLWANVKSTRATVGHKEKLSSLRTFFLLLISCLFQLCWLNLLDLFLGRRRGTREQCQVCAPSFFS